jgi:hypothetical protein
VPLFKITIVHDEPKGESDSHNYETRSGEIFLIAINSILALLTLGITVATAVDAHFGGWLCFFIGLLAAATAVALNLRLGSWAAIWCERLDAITFPKRFTPWTDDGLMIVGGVWLPVLVFWAAVAAYMHAIRLLYPTRRRTADRTQKKSS